MKLVSTSADIGTMISIRDVDVNALLYMNHFTTMFQRWNDYTINRCWMGTLPSQYTMTSVWRGKRPAIMGRQRW
jgi:hypothetical protein